jgi:hypothetical protein
MTATKPWNESHKITAVRVRPNGPGSLQFNLFMFEGLQDGAGAAKDGQRELIFFCDARTRSSSIEKTSFEMIRAQKASINQQ